MVLIWKFSVAFLLDKTVVYSVTPAEDGYVGILTEPAGDCTHGDYSEKGNIIQMGAPGGVSQLLGHDGGVYVANITYGGESFSVQLDTGSPTLM